MNTQIAIGLGLALVALFSLDGGLNDWQATIFTARKGTDLIEWLAFWR